MRRLLVCGGRVGVRPGIVAPVMQVMVQELGSPFVVIEGQAEGYDQLAGAWADANGFVHERYPIDNRLDGVGVKAPFSRNRRMLRVSQPDACLGFPGFNGTLDMMTLCQEAGLPVYDAEVMDLELRLRRWPLKEKIAA